MATRRVAQVRPARRHTGKRERILDAALRAFVRHGYTKTSMDTISREARVAKQTLYNHFTDKEQLFYEVVRSAQQRVGSDVDTSGLEAWLGSSEDLDRDLRAFGRDAIRASFREDAVALRLLVHSECEHHPELLRELARPGPLYEEALARAIHRQARHGRLETPDPQRAARQLNMVLFHEASVRSLFGRRQLSETEIDDIVDTGVELWLRAYRAQRIASNEATRRPRLGSAARIGTVARSSPR